MAKHKRKQQFSDQEAQKEIVETVKLLKEMDEAQAVISDVERGTLTFTTLRNYFFVLFYLGMKMAVGRDHLNPSVTKKIKLGKAPKVEVSDDQISPQSILEWGNYSLANGWFMIINMEREGLSPADLENNGEIVGQKVQLLLVNALTAYAKAGGRKPQLD